MKAKTRHLLILPALLFGLVTWAQVAKTPKRGLENPQETVTLASISLNGTIFTSNKSAILQFDFTLGNPQIYYSIKGSTRSTSGWATDVLDYGTIRVDKHLKTADGRIISELLKNNGIMKAVRGKRTLEDMTLANMKISGMFSHGRIDDGLWFSGLVVDGSNSAGALDYNSYNGHYTPEDGCSFGDCKIGSRPGKTALDYDNSVFTSTNLFDVALEFGDLIVTGKINFSDVMDTTISLNTDSEDTLVPSVQQAVAATTGHINLDIVRKDGKPFALSHPNGKPTVDDGQLRKLVAFLELMAYDLFAE